jgi:RNA methyltransferase, TrmH family
MLIASLSNPTVKRLRLLHERRGRAQQGLFLVEGVRLVEEALEGGVQPDTVLVAPAMLDTTARGRALLQRLMHQRDLPPPLEVTPAVLRHVADTETPSGVVAALPLGPAHALAELPRRAGLALVLDGVQDPGNAGTILRTAAAAGVDAVVALAGCVDLYAPKVVRAGMGAHFRLALAVDVDVTTLPSWLASCGQALLADPQATQSIYDVDLRGPVVLIVGSEAHGAVRAEALPGLHRAAIPMPGGMESLNVAVATAVILFEALRQRRG